MVYWFTLKNDTIGLYNNSNSKGPKDLQVSQFLQKFDATSARFVEGKSSRFECMRPTP